MDADIVTDCRGDRLRFGFGVYHDLEEMPGLPPDRPGSWLTRRRFAPDFLGVLSLSTGRRRTYIHGVGKPTTALNGFVE